MKRFARMLFAGLGIVIAGSALSLLPHKPATAGGMTAVTVTNVPLPVTQSGPWNVGINGTPSVNANITNQVPVTGTVNANVSFPANQQVTLALQSLLNLGKLPSQQVILTSNSSCPAVWANPSTGQCFTLPGGSVLVLTDVDWSAQATLSSSSSPSGHSCFLKIYDGSGANPIVFSYGSSDADGVVSNNEHLSGGLYLDPAGIGPFHQALLALVGGACVTPSQVVVRGYLVPNQ